MKQNTHATNFRTRATTTTLGADHSPQQKKQTSLLSHVQVNFMMSSIQRVVVFTLMVFQHQVQDSSCNTGTHHFCCHGCTGFQRYCHFTDCDPLVPVHKFDQLLVLLCECEQRYPEAVTTCLVSFLSLLGFFFSTILDLRVA